MISTILYGVAARLISPFIKVKKNVWIMGADKGNTYRESTKYLLEYMLKNHPEYDCTFITQNPQVVQELQQKGIPCLRNNTFKAILKIATAEAVFTTQGTSDVRFAYPKKGRKYYYILHGMSQKRSWTQLPEGYVRKLQIGSGVISWLRAHVSEFLTIGYTIADVSFLSSCSDFLVQFVKLDFGQHQNVKILGLPRNDGLFDQERMKKERWIDGLEGKFVITYMPTHRAYGAGEITPTPFVNRPEIQDWMREHNVVLLMKNHPNMIPRIKDVNNSDVIKDITKLYLDPQVCIYHSNVLITDFSSVWMDYLLLRRPLIFYIYDNFEQDDAGVYYDVRDYLPENFCQTEDQLFDMIKQIVKDKESFKPSDQVVAQFHKFVDGNSSERYFNALVEDLS